MGVFLKLTNASDAKYGPILKKSDFGSETFIFITFVYSKPYMRRGLSHGAQFGVAVKPGAALQASPTCLKMLKVTM